MRGRGGFTPLRFIRWDFLEERNPGKGTERFSVDNPPSLFGIAKIELKGVNFLKAPS